MQALLFIFLYHQSTHAYFEIDCYTSKNCDGDQSKRTSSAGNPSFGNRININPSAIPTEDGTGLEGILYKGTVDFSLVRGTGRVGAAISPSNSEETFFGPPSIEFDSDYFERKLNSDKYQNQK